MAGYPARNHTAYGRAWMARNDRPFCRNEQPDPGCDCDACDRYFVALERRTVPANNPFHEE